MNQPHNIDQDALLEQLEQADMDYWYPEPGDVLSGRVLRYEHRDSRYGPYVCAVLAAEPDGEPLGVRIQHAVLRQQFNLHRPRPGERIALKRKEDRVGPNGRYRHFVLAVERQGETDIPDDFGSEDPEQDRNLPF